MDAAKVFPKCVLVLEIVRMWVAAIQPNLRAMEPHKGMDCMDMTAVRAIVGETPPTALCQAIIVLGGAPPSILLKFSQLGFRSRGMSHP